MGRAKTAKRIAEYIAAWAWRARRHGEDHFQQQAKSSVVGAAAAGAPMPRDEALELDADDTVVDNAQVV